MNTDYNTIIINQIRRKISSDESIGHTLSEILNISTDAVYRRLRNEKAFTVKELVAISRYFNFSLDALFQSNANKVTFDYDTLQFNHFSVDEYLKSIHQLIQQLANSEKPQLILTVNNTPFFQLFNFRTLLKVKLFFWAKSQLKAEKYRQLNLDDFTLSSNQVRLCDEILNAYNKIPSIEVYDIELLRGFAREISYHALSADWISNEEAATVFKELKNLVEHLKAQTALGKKYKFNTEAPQTSSNFEVFYNETLNASATFHYTTKAGEGLFITHNFLNPLHTQEENYVKESKSVLNNLLSVSTKISEVNQKARTIFFESILKNIEAEK